MLVAAGALPASAAAHAVPGIDYRFPLPIWLGGFSGAQDFFENPRVLQAPSVA